MQKYDIPTKNPYFCADFNRYNTFLMIFHFIFMQFIHAFCNLIKYF